MDRRLVQQRSTFAANLFAQMKKRNLGLQELANAVYVDEATVRRWLSASAIPNPRNLHQLSFFLNVEIPVLLR